MSPLRLYPPSDFLLNGVAMDIDPADAEELKASTGGESIMETLVLSRDLSFECYVGVIDDTPVAVFGIALADIDGTTGCPWAVFTNAMREYPKELMTASRTVVSRWRQMFPFLENHVDSRNTRAIRWLRRLGFTVHEHAADPSIEPFYRFEMRNV